MKRVSVTLLLIVSAIFSFSQNVDKWAGQDGSRVVTTAVPFLIIAPDARSGGMGEVGVASEPDASSMHWNPAKYAFIDKKFGFALSYSPWLRELVSDINLAYLAGFYKIDDRQTVAASLLYFSLGEITFTDEFGEDLGTYKPNEFSLDATYSRKFSEEISGAVAGRFIYSNLTQGQFVQGVETSPGTSIAADAAVYYEKEVDLGNVSSDVTWGINLSNIGSKISYSKQSTKKDFIPTNLRLGGGLKMNFDDYNSLALLLDLNKLMVPTPPIYLRDSSGNPVIDPATNNPVIDKGKDPNVSPVAGIIQSWYDAPHGFSEEMREWAIAFGMEYWYAKQFSLRTGFFYEDKTKGNRKFITVGAGLRYSVFGLDLSYLIPFEQQHPLENTLRFTLHFNFDPDKESDLPRK
ncbi:MAG TPA: type IX secretion system outer membrane channel protein PorV [Bacteroidales bacterium]|nr:type IX secretion system outer membrane channel protein PorV [Bacteroidales bacterium]HOX76852.1 type IX secretion system outer membrane channel protein PorV [Bacteroidales bacterium]HPI86128.1 type IX secretion system outer membrane channel protein PorV [Bacteroidales bacterium]